MRCTEMFIAAVDDGMCPSDVRNLPSYASLVSTFTATSAATLDYPTVQQICNATSAMLADPTINTCLSHFANKVLYSGTLLEGAFGVSKVRCVRCGGACVCSIAACLNLSRLANRQSPYTRASRRTTPQTPS